MLNTKKIITYVETLKKIRHDETTVCYQAVLSELSPFDKLHLTSFQQDKEAFLP
jgi:hypothetical protein